MITAAVSRKRVRTKGVRNDGAEEAESAGSGRIPHCFRHSVIGRARLVERSSRVNEGERRESENGGHTASAA
jgi:hypothetical protein